MPIRDLIILAIVFGSVPYILKRPHVGMLMWAWVSYMNPHRLTWGIAYDFPVAAIVGGAFLVSLFLSKEPKKLPWSPILKVWFAFILWMNVTTVFALNSVGAYNEWNRSMKIQLMAILTLMVMRSRERINALVWVIALSIGFFGVKGGLFAIRTGGQWEVLGPPESFIYGNNEIGFALVMVLPLLRYLQMQLQKRWQVMAMSFAMLLCGLSILSTYSRGAFLAVAAMLAFLILRSRKRGLMIMVGVLAVPVMLSFMPEKWSERMGTIQTYEEDGSAMGRINAWWFAYNLAKDRPLIGGGYRAFTPRLFYRYAPIPEDHHDAHSIYFEVLGEQGFVGLALFLLLGLMAFSSCQWTIRHTRRREELRWAYDLGSMLQVSLLGYAMGGLFLGLAYFDLPYHLIGLAILVKLYVARELGLLKNNTRGSPRTTKRVASTYGSQTR